MQPPLLKACTSKIQLQHRVCNAPITSGPKGWKSKSFLSRHCQELFLYGSNLGPEPAGRCLHYFLSQWKHISIHRTTLCVEPESSSQEQHPGTSPFLIQKVPNNLGGYLETGFIQKSLIWNSFSKKKNLPFASKVQLVGTGEDLMVSRGDSQLRALS